MGGLHAAYNDAFNRAGDTASRARGASDQNREGVTNSRAKAMRNWEPIAAAMPA